MDEENQQEHFSPESTEAGEVPQQNTDINEGFSLDKPTLIVLALAVVLAGAIGGVYVYFNYMAPNSGIFMSEEEAREQFLFHMQQGAIASENGENDTARTHFEKAFDIAPNSRLKGNAHIYLALLTFYEDQKAGIEELKEVSTNTEYGPVTRASAANKVLEEWTSSADEELARNYIFTGPVWGEFLAQSEDLEEAELKAFEYSSRIRPTIAAEFRIAVWYAGSLYDDDLDKETKDEYAQIALEHLEEGNELLFELQHENITSDFPRIAIGYNRKGMALGDLYLNGYIDDIERVEEAFEAGLDVILANTSEGGWYYGTGLFIRFNHAAFLVRLNDTARNEGIQKMLAPIVSAPEDYEIFDFLASRARGDELVPNYHNIIVDLANISTDFKEKLLQIGWQESDFTKQ